MKLHEITEPKHYHNPVSETHSNYGNNYSQEELEEIIADSIAPIDSDIPGVNLYLELEEVLFLLGVFSPNKSTIKRAGKILDRMGIPAVETDGISRREVKIRDF